MTNTSQVSVMDVMTLQRYVKIVTDRADLAVEWKNGLAEPSVKKNTMYLPALHNNMTKVQLDKVRYFVLHATLYYTEGTNFKLVSDTGLKPENPLGAIFYILENHRIERSGALQYKGDAQIMDSVYPMVADNLLDAVKANVQEADSPQSKMACMIYFDLCCRSDWLTSIDLVASEHHKVLSSNGAGVHLPKIEGLGFDTRLSRLETTEQILDLAKDMYQALFDEDPEEQMEEMKQQAQQQQQAGGEESSEGSKGGATEAGEGKREGNGKSNKKQIVKYDWTTLSEEDGSKPTSDLTIDYTDWSYDKSTAYRPQAFKDMSITDMSKSGELGDRYTTLTRAIAESNTKSKALASKLRRLLEINSKSRVTHGKKKGKLDKKNIHRVGVTHPGLKDYSHRVFKTKESKDVLDTAVLVLCDVSGSMSGDKINHAGVSAALLNTAISTSLRIPLEIQTFTHTVIHGNIINIVKRFDTSVNTANLVKNFSCASYDMGHNADGEAISYAAHCLLKRKEKRKLLVVLSDGQPAIRGGSGDIAAYTKTVVNELEVRGDIDVAAIGIETNSVEHFYKNYSIINDSNDLEKALLDTISRQIL